MDGKLYPNQKYLLLTFRLMFTNPQMSINFHGIASFLKYGNHITDN